MCVNVCDVCGTYVVFVYVCVFGVGHGLCGCVYCPMPEYHTCVELRESLLGVGFLLPWFLGLKLRSSGLSNKGFYLLSHVTSPYCVFFLIIMTSSPCLSSLPL